MGHCCSYISHFLGTVVTRTYPKSSPICRCGLASTLHARGCLARGVFFAARLVRFHGGFEGWLWEQHFTMTQTEPQNMLKSDTVCCEAHIYLLPSAKWGGGYFFRFIPCRSLDLVHYTCGVDCWTWSSWTCGIYMFLH